MSLTEEEIQKIWSILTDSPWIAGPWVPYKNKIYRFNHCGQPLASAVSQTEIESEDIRLESLGYLLTDKNRKIPASWF